MKYKGKLYGKVGNEFIPLEDSNGIPHSTQEYDRLQAEAKKWKVESSRLRDERDRYKAEVDKLKRFLKEKEAFIDSITADRSEEQTDISNAVRGPINPKR